MDVFASKPMVFADGIAQNESNESRWIPFSGVRNFRDLGGYRTVGGQTIRRGLLYRSANLHNLTDKDLQRLDRLSLKKSLTFEQTLKRTVNLTGFPVIQISK